jgi:multiple sugar transport system permease protein
MKTLMRKKTSYENWGRIFVAPYFVIFFIFQLFPILFTLFLTTVKWDGITGMQFIGLKNFTRLLTDEYFYQSLWTTLRIWVVAAIPQILLALLLASLFSYRKICGAKLFQAIFYFPNLITATSIAVLFSILLDPHGGALNQFLIKTHLIDYPIRWLTIPKWASLTVSFIQWWQWFGYTMILVSAGIKAIPNELYEAAKIDGASFFTSFTRIILPLLRNTLTYVLITSIIGGLQIFDVPSVLTGGLGEPDRSILTSVMYLYNTSFRYSNYGYGSTIAYGLFIVILAFSILSYRNLQRRSS